MAVLHVFHQHHVRSPHILIQPFEVIVTLFFIQPSHAIKVVCFGDEKIVPLDIVTPECFFIPGVILRSEYIDNEIIQVTALLVLPADIEIIFQDLSGQVFHGKVGSKKTAALATFLFAFNQLFSKGRQIH